MRVRLQPETHSRRKDLSPGIRLLLLAATGLTPDERYQRFRIADGIAVARPHPGAFELLRNEIERVVEVSDDAVEAAMRAYFRATYNVAEGAGAAALAAVFQEHTQIVGKRVAAVLTGGNVDSDVYCQVLTTGSEGQPQPGR